MKHKLQTLLKHKLQWLLLLAALFGVSQGVWGYKSGCYITGEWDNWNYWHSLSSTGDEVTINLEASHTYRFNAKRKYDDDSGHHEFGCGGCSKTGSGDVTLYHADNNNYANLTTTVAGGYKFKLNGWDNNNPIITVTFPSAPAATFTEGKLVWLDIRGGNACWGKETSAGTESMFLQFYDGSSWGNTRALTEVAVGSGTHKTNTLWVYRITSTDAALNSEKIKFWRGKGDGTCNDCLWNYSVELTAAEVSAGTYNGVYISNCSNWDNNGTKFNFTTSNNVVSTPTLTMKDGAGSDEISSCTSGETVRFYETTQTITTTISSTSKARTLSHPLYTYTFSEGSYSSGQTTDNPHDWTTTDDYVGSGNANVEITFAIDNTPTPASSISSGYAKESSGTSFTVNASCTAPNTSNFTVTSGTNTYVYNGSAHSATVTGVSPYTPSNIVAYYGINSSTTATSQTDAGTYNIYVHSADADAGYCAVTSTITTALTTQLVISPVTPSSSNYSDLFSITGTGSHAYTGVAQSVAVAWKSPYTGCTGDITVKYDDSTDAPSNVGVYPITISVAAGTNNNASASDISVGTLTITAISPGLALGDISNKCGTGDYALRSTSNSAGAVTYSVTSGNATIVNGTTLRVNATGDVTVQASQVADGNYTAQVVSRTYSFASAPVAGFSASADAETLEFSNTEYVPTTLRTDANSEWDFKWVCDSHPTWGTNNTPTIVSSTSNSTEVRFPIEGVYTFHVGAKCKKDNSYVSSSTVTVTVKLPLCIKGPLTDSNGSWNSYELISNISNSNTRTYSFTAFNKGTNIREFVLDASASGDDKHHIHTSSTVGNLALTGLDYNSGNHYNLRALESLGISESGTRVVLTITHNGGYYYNLSLALDCTTPEAKTISISASSVCEGESANVIVGSSQSGYIYTVYDSNSGVAGSGTGDGSNLNISVTPSAGTTYTVKAKQADACLETSMANTVDISVNERPSFTPSTGITQYAPVTVTSTALSPSWSIASKDPDVDAAWISTTSGSSTVLKAPTGTYTVSDGGPCPTNAIVVSNDTEICN